VKIVPLKGWKCSRIWDKFKQIKIIFRKKIRADCSQGMLCYHSEQNPSSSNFPSKNLKTKIYKSIILTVVVYGCKTWSLTLREERRLKVFENGVLRGIFGPKRGRDREWRKLHNEEIYDTYSSPFIFHHLFFGS
jgi:hypothetical protein